MCSMTVLTFPFTSHSLRWFFLWSFPFTTAVLSLSTLPFADVDGHRCGCWYWTVLKHQSFQQSSTNTVCNNCNVLPLNDCSRTTVIISSHSKTRGVTVCLLETRTILAGFRKRHSKTGRNAADVDVSYLDSIWQSLPPALKGDVCYSTPWFYCCKESCCQLNLFLHCLFPASCSWVSSQSICLFDTIEI